MGIHDKILSFQSTSSISIKIEELKRAIGIPYIVTVFKENANIENKEKEIMPFITMVFSCPAKFNSVPSGPEIAITKVLAATRQKNTILSASLYEDPNRSKIFSIQLSLLLKREWLCKH